MKKKKIIVVISICLLISAFAMLAYLYINDQEDMRSCNYINDDLRNQITELEKENETLNKKFNSLTNDHSLLQKDYKWLKVDYDTLKDDHGKLEDKNEDLERELSSCRMSRSY